MDGWLREQRIKEYFEIMLRKDSRLKCKRRYNY